MLPALSEADLERLAKEDPLGYAYLAWQAAWTATARANQIIPKFHPETDELWTECGVQAGRGFGKTRVGAEWIGRECFEAEHTFPAAVICPTFSDVKFTAFEGESGLLSVVPPDLIAGYNKSDLTIEMRNCAGKTRTIRGFSSEKPERLRGPQHFIGWCDELAAWQNPEDTWDMYQFGLRLGPNPQTLWTSTPKPKELVRKLITRKPGRFIIRGSTDDNRANLPDSFFRQVEQYRGTTLGRQELAGELIDPEEAGIVKRSQFRLWPHDKPLPVFQWIIVSLDTAFTEKTVDKKTHDPDPTACTVWGVFLHEKRANILLLDCWEEFLGFPELVRRARKEMATAYGDDDGPHIEPLHGPGRTMGSPGRKPDILLIEDKGSGISLRQALEQEGVFAYAYNPGRADKLSRLHMVSPLFARRLVWLPESNHPARRGQPRNWCDAMVTQLCSFTGVGSIKHDDFVDSTTQALRLCLDKQLLSPLVPTRKEKEQAEEDYVERQARGPVQNPYSA